MIDATPTPTRRRIDFDEWSRLARTDPSAFEARRQQTLAAFMDQIPQERQHRMRCLQWRIDEVRRRAETPLASCVRMSDMMWHSVLGDEGLLKALQSSAGTPENHRQFLKKRKTAKVVPFRQAKRPPQSD